MRETTQVTPVTQEGKPRAKTDRNTEKTLQKRKFSELLISTGVFSVPERLTEPRQPPALFASFFSAITLLSSGLAL
jgi:hypothetical protein